MQYNPTIAMMPGMMSAAYPPMPAWAPLPPCFAANTNDGSMTSGYACAEDNEWGSGTTYTAAPYHHDPYAMKKSQPAIRRSASASSNDSHNFAPIEGQSPAMTPSKRGDILPPPLTSNFSSFCATAASTSPDSTVRAASDFVLPSAPLSREERLVAAFAEALMFLPLEDIDRARLATPQLAAAAERVAPAPLPAAMNFVRWVPQEPKTTLPPTKAQRAALASGAAVPAMFRWQCLACNTRTAGPRYCRACRTPMAEGACRVFIGQLRKDLTAELVTAMIRCLLPGVELLHVESHTSAADGHGRGCAWVFVGSVADARRVVTLHKRVFIDVDGEGADGYWYARELGLEDALESFAAARATDGERPTGLPRLPVVAEAPARSRIAAHLVQAVA